MDSGAGGLEEVSLEPEVAGAYAVQEPALRRVPAQANPHSAPHNPLTSKERRRKRNQEGERREKLPMSKDKRRNKSKVFENKIPNENKTIKLQCIQQNFKKNVMASIEFNKNTFRYKNLFCFATEPYIAFDRVGNLGRGLNSYPSTNSRPRAAFIYYDSSGFIGIDKLTSRDCAVGFLKLNDQVIVVASVYCDITKEMVSKELKDLSLIHI